MAERPHPECDHLRLYVHVPYWIERGGPVEQVMRLGETDRMAQLIAPSLGDGKPLARARYAQAFGRAIDEDFGDVLSRLTGAGLIDDDGAMLALSELGKLAHDLVTLAFSPAHAREWLVGRRERASPMRPDPGAAS